MYILTIHFPHSDGATFDFDYFQVRHLPALGEAFAPFGLGYASVLRGEQSLDGSAPAFFASVLLSFRDEQGARDAVASDAGQSLFKDSANFTNVTPAMQFNTPLP